MLFQTALFLTVFCFFLAQKEERVVQESNLGILVLQIMNVSSFKKKKICSH